MIVFISSIIVIHYQLVKSVAILLWSGTWCNSLKYAFEFT